MSQTKNLVVSGTPNSKRTRDDLDKSPVKTEFQLFKEEIKDLLYGWKTEQDTVLAKIMDEMTEIKTQNLEFQKSNMEIIKAMEFINSSYEDMKLKIERLEKELRESVLSVSASEDQLEELQRSNRNSGIEIRNIPANPKETKANLVETTQKIFSFLKVPYDHHTIKDCYRSGKLDDKGTRPITVELCSNIVRSDLLVTLRKYNQDHQNAKLNSSLIGLDKLSNAVYVTELLTAKSKKLFYLARGAAVTHKYAYCWTSYGKVYLRKQEGANAIPITSESQLKGLGKVI